MSRRVWSVGVIAALVATPLAHPVSLHAQSAPRAGVDSAPSVERVPWLKRGDLESTGWTLLATAIVATQDRNISNAFADSTLQANGTYKSISGSLTTIHERSMLGYSLVVFAGARVFGNAPIADGALHVAEAVAIGTVVGSFLKSTTGRARPRAADGDPFDFRFGKGYTAGEYRSFPSLHEIGSFSAAAALTGEVARHSRRYGQIVGILAYGTAGAVGISRMYAAEHWASDVVLGTAIGVFLGRRVVDHAHSGPPNKLDKFLLGPLAASENGMSIMLYSRDF